MNRKINLRQGSCCLIVNNEKTKVVVENDGIILGGAMEPNETPFAACIREVNRQTKAQIVINSDNINFLKKTTVTTDSMSKFNWDGKDMYVYVYFIDEKTFTPFEYQNTDSEGKNTTMNKIHWMDITEFFTKSNSVSKEELEIAELI
jgi:ADP-ribose pyrophosphatase YjhB (NUDIX family)